MSNMLRTFCTLFVFSVLLGNSAKAAGYDDIQPQIEFHASYLLTSADTLDPDLPDAILCASLGLFKQKLIASKKQSLPALHLSHQYSIQLIRAPPQNS